MLKELYFLYTLFKINFLMLISTPRKPSWLLSRKWFWTLSPWACYCERLDLRAIYWFPIFNNLMGQPFNFLLEMLLLDSLFLSLQLLNWLLVEGKHLFTWLDICRQNRSYNRGDCQFFFWLLMNWWNFFLLYFLLLLYLVSLLLSLCLVFIIFSEGLKECFNFLGTNFPHLPILIKCEY